LGKALNLWLSQKKRRGICGARRRLRQIAYILRTVLWTLSGVHGGGHRKRVTTSPRIAPLRMPRSATDVTPTFLLTGEKLTPEKPERQVYADLLIANPQFARATVNLFWAQLMGRGIVDPPFGFDMARQDPAKPPPAPWTIQPTHPELLNALAEDFRRHHYDLRYLLKTIVSSTSYQLATEMDEPHTPAVDEHFAAHITRRLSAEELWDAISQAANVFDEIQSKYAVRKYKRVMQASFYIFYHDYEGTLKNTFDLLQCFGANRPGRNAFRSLEPGAVSQPVEWRTRAGPYQDSERQPPRSAVKLEAAPYGR